MKKILFYIFKFLCVSLLSLLLFLPGMSGSLHAMDLPKQIDKTNCAQYKDLLIPAMYRAVERGDFVITTGKINFDYKLPTRFIEAGAKNEGKCDIDLKDELISKSTGKYPENIYGFPFPKIDLKDPKAGSKIMYNFKYVVYRFMGTRDRTYMAWIDKTGLERYVFGMDTRLYMVGRPPGQEIKNPDKVEHYEFPRIMEPMGSKGINTLAYVYIDSKDDTFYAYVPAIRRIRQTGSTTRSDPYMGSDAWQDTNGLWSGKNSSMNWKYIGEKTILVGFTSPNMLPAQELPDESMIRTYPYTGIHLKCGYEDPKWKGAPWAPMNITYTPRKVWIVEQIPKDPYYNWGRHLNYIDQETYTIWYKEVWEKSGDFRTWIINLHHYNEAPSGNNNTGKFENAVFIDEKARHATFLSFSADPKESIYIYICQLQD